MCSRKGSCTRICIQCTRLDEIGAAVHRRLRRGNNLAVAVAGNGNVVSGVCSSLFRVCNAGVRQENANLIRESFGAFDRRVLNQWSTHTRSVRSMNMSCTNDGWQNDHESTVRA